MSSNSNQQWSGGRHIFLSFPLKTFLGAYICIYAMLHNLKEVFPMNDWDYVNFSEVHEMNYHLGLVGKSKSEDNRKYLRDNTQWTAKNKLDKTRITHTEFKPFVVADKPYLQDPA